MKENKKISKIDSFTATADEEKDFLSSKGNRTSCYNCLKMIIKEKSIKKEYSLSLLKEKVVRLI